MTFCTKLTQVVFIVEVIAAVVHSCGLRGEYPLSLEKQNRKIKLVLHMQTTAANHIVITAAMIILSLALGPPVLDLQTSTNRINQRESDKQTVPPAAVRFRYGKLRGSNRKHTSTKAWCHMPSLLPTLTEHITAPNQHLTARTAGWKQWRNAQKTSCSESFPFTVMVFASSSVCLQPPWAKILFIIYSWCRLCFWYPGQKQASAKGTWPPDRGPGSRRHSWLQFQGHLLWEHVPPLA